MNGSNPTGKRVEWFFCLSLFLSNIFDRKFLKAIFVFLFFESAHAATCQPGSYSSSQVEYDPSVSRCYDGLVYEKTNELCIGLEAGQAKFSATPFNASTHACLNGGKVISKSDLFGECSSKVKVSATELSVVDGKAVDKLVSLLCRLNVESALLNGLPAVNKVLIQHDPSGTSTAIVKEALAAPVLNTDDATVNKLLASNESGIAEFVVGHELGHYALGHKFDRNFRDAVLKLGGLVVAGKSVLELAKGNFGKAVVSASVGGGVEVLAYCQAFSAYKQEELNADYFSLNILKRAGFDYIKAAGQFIKFMGEYGVDPDEPKCTDLKGVSMLKGSVGDRKPHPSYRNRKKAIMDRVKYLSAPG